MKMRVKKICIELLVCACLAASIIACTYQGMSFCECPDIFIFQQRCNVLRNDLLSATYYCGSDDKWHYFAIEQRVLFVDELNGLKMPNSTVLPFAIRSFTLDRKQWLVVDDFADLFYGHSDCEFPEGEGSLEIPKCIEGEG